MKFMWKRNTRLCQCCRISSTKGRIKRGATPRADFNLAISLQWSPISRIVLFFHLRCHRRLPLRIYGQYILFRQIRFPGEEVLRSFKSARHTAFFLSLRLQHKGIRAPPGIFCEIAFWIALLFVIRCWDGFT